MAAACAGKREGSGSPSSDPELAKRGNIEVTAKLVEVPKGAIFERELYNYATVLKYQVLEVHRGRVKGDTIYVGHYNPCKPRSEASDKRVQGIGGDLKSFRAGDVHRMALDGTMLDHFHGRDPQPVLGGRHRPDLLGRLDGPGQRLTGRVRDKPFQRPAPRVHGLADHGLHHLSLRLLLSAALPGVLLRPGSLEPGSRCVGWPDLPGCSTPSWSSQATSSTAGGIPGSSS